MSTVLLKYRAFRKDLLELKEQIEEGKTEFTVSAQKKIDNYLTCSRKGRGGRLKVGFNDEAKKYFGYFALASNQSMDTFTALKNYRLREKIKEVQVKLRKKEPETPKSRIKLEKKLDNWLSQRSLAQTPGLVRLH